MFYISHAEHNLIKLKLYNNLTAQAVNKISECVCYVIFKQINEIRLPLKIRQSIKSE